MIRPEDVHPGLKARVTANSLGAPHPDDNSRRLHPGDIIILLSPAEQVTFSGFPDLGPGTHLRMAVVYHCSHYHHRVLLDEIEIAGEQETTDPIRKCSCPPENFTLNGRGCTCGGS